LKYCTLMPKVYPLKQSLSIGNGDLHTETRGTVDADGSRLRVHRLIGVPVL